MSASFASAKLSYTVSPFAMRASFELAQQTSDIIIWIHLQILLLLACAKSLIYIINNRGPRIEPCGMPVVLYC